MGTTSNHSTSSCCDALFSDVSTCLLRLGCILPVKLLSSYITNPSSVGTWISGSSRPSWDWGDVRVRH